MIYKRYNLMKIEYIPVTCKAFNNFDRNLCFTVHTFDSTYPSLILTYIPVDCHFILNIQTMDSTYCGIIKILRSQASLIQSGNLSSIKGGGTFTKLVELVGSILFVKEMGQRTDMRFIILSICFLLSSFYGMHQ